MAIESKKSNVAFAAIDPYLERNIISPKERVISSKDMVEWGDGNAYPDYLLDLYKNVATLHSVINGNVDFITGEDVFIQALGDKFVNGIMNKRGDTIREQVRDCAQDDEIFGGHALQIIRSLDGKVNEIYHIDLRFLRWNKERDVFYYSEHWADRGRKNVVVYPKFIPNLDWASLKDEERNRHASSILLVCNTRTQVYPAPIYAAAVLACETERAVNEYHWNSLNNDFCPSAIINFNNGDPGDKMKEEIEEDMNEKFGGYKNGNRFMLIWNKDKESATTIQVLRTDDFGARYQALADNSRRQIFSAFRAIPLLFGLTSEANTGFSTTEFSESFKLYNRTQIRPIQKTIADTYDKIYGAQGVLTIVPFSIESDTETNVN